MKVPLLDLVTQCAAIKPELVAAFGEVVDSARFILGPKVEELEKQICKYTGAACGIGVTSGTDALLVSLMALEVGAGDEVVTTPYTFFATAGVVHRLGAKPVFVDIDPATCNIDAGALAGAITKKTKAVIPVHLYGQCADMDAVLAAADGVPVVEDAAQSLGGIYKGKHAGTMGALGCYSFFPSKNLGGFGDGGMVVTNDKTLGDKVRKLRVHGSAPKYYHAMVGMNARLDALQAALLLVKLPHLDNWAAGRAKNADAYRAKFEAAGLSGKVTPPTDAGFGRHVYNQFVIRVPSADRDKLREHLKARDIGNEVYYPLALHMQECFGYLGYSEGDFPHSEAAARETIALPVYPELTDEMMDYVVGAIAEYFGK